MKKGTQNKQTGRTIWYACNGIFFITLIASLYINIKDYDANALMMSGVAVLTLMIVPVIFKLLKWKPVYEIYIISTIFVYFASLLGSSLSWYSYTGFDKALHFSSGLGLCVVAVILYLFIKKNNAFANKNEYMIYLVFVNAVNISFAVFWEFYEYALLVFFDNDAIHHYSEGVHDTITDMLCAFIGGLIVTGFLIRYHKTKKQNVFTKLIDKFYQVNIKDQEIDQ